MKKVFLLGAFALGTITFANAEDNSFKSQTSEVNIESEDDGCYVRVHRYENDNGEVYLTRKIRHCS